MRGERIDERLQQLARRVVRAGRVVVIVRLPLQIDLRLPDGDQPQPVHRGLQVRLRPQRAQDTRRGAGAGGGFARQRGLSVRTAAPVEGVGQQAWNVAVVFRRDDEDARRRRHLCLHPVTVLSIVAGLAAVFLLILLVRANARAADLLRDLQSARAAEHAAALREVELAAGATAGRTRLAELAEERDGLIDALHQLREVKATLERDLATVRLTAEKDASAAQGELKLLRDLREEMTAQFRLMADDSLRRQGADLEKAHADRLSALLKPVRDQVETFQKELADRNIATVQANAALREQIEGLHRRSEEIGRDAVALTRAL